jgi:ABC-2 type transport system permease protein
MAPYLAIARRSFQRALEYRVEFWAEFLINLLFMYIYACLWRALYAHRTSASGYTLQQMLTYIIVAQTLLTFNFTLRLPGILTEKVRSGAISTDLIKPVDFQFLTLAEGLGTSAHTVLFNMLPKFFLFYFLLHTSAPPTFAHGLAFLVSVALGYGVLAATQFAVAATALHIVETRGVNALVTWVVNWLFAGYFVPLTFYPALMQRIAMALPFQCTVYVPTLIYSGRLSGPDLLSGLGLQALWLVALVFLGRAILLAGRARLAIQGG